jgi:hypothetical protein
MGRKKETALELLESPGAVTALGEINDLAHKLLEACEQIPDAALRKRAEMEIVGVFAARHEPTMLDIPKGSFYEIQDNIQALIDTVEGMDEGTPQRAEAEQELAGWFEAEVRKVDAIAGYIDFCASNAALAKKGAERFSKQAEAWRNREQRTRDTAQMVMEKFNLPKIPGRMATFSLSPTQPSVIITNEAEIPAHFKEYAVSIKKDEIKKAIKAGEDVPGADLSMGGVTLRIT